MRLIKKYIIRLLGKIFNWDKFKKRRIKEGPLRGLFYYGRYRDKRYFDSLYEKKVVNLVKKNVTKGNVYDIGAHYGFYSLLFAKLIRKEGKVYSFEPNPYCLKRLRQAVSLNRLDDKVKIFDFGIGETNRRVEMMVLLDNLGRSTCNEHLKNWYKNRTNFARKIEIKIRSLDTLNLPKPTLVKIDVEGFEVKVIKGMSEIITRYLPDLIIEIHGKDREKRKKTAIQLLELLWNFGYYCINIEDNRLLSSLNDDIPSRGHLYVSENKQKILRIKKETGMAKLI